MVFLPMIDLNPSDPTCIFSTMQFVYYQTLRYKFTPILTFDKPFFLKLSKLEKTSKSTVRIFASQGSDPLPSSSEEGSGSEPWLAKMTVS